MISSLLLIAFGVFLGHFFIPPTQTAAKLRNLVVEKFPALGKYARKDVE